MYTVTFYSFKGGVGRSMAMVNVAYLLASKGKRVLMVDFDLEAPGLDTFPLDVGLAPPQRGVVEFIGDYLQTDKAPDVREYVTEAAAPPHPDGKLWVMPSGIPDDSYGRRLHAINWTEL